jgi:hypothetical protein
MKKKHTTPARTSPPAEELARVIVELVAQTQGSLTGAELGTALKQRFRGLRFGNYGVAKLRDFIRVHVPSVVIVDRQGGDVLYAAKRWSGAAPALKVTQDRTLAQLTGLTELTTDSAELLNLIRDEATTCRDAGDMLGAGEWFASMFPYLDGGELEEAFTKAIASWASPLHAKTLPPRIESLIPALQDFVPEHLAAAVVAATSHLLRESKPLPPTTGDLSFRLMPQLEAGFEVASQSPKATCTSAARRLESARSELFAAVDSFGKTTPIAAKAASIELVRIASSLRRITLAAERPILGEMCTLLGPGFRKFCEACERQQPHGIVRRGPELRRQVSPLMSTPGAKETSTLWHVVVLPVCKKVVELVDEALAASTAATAPALMLIHDVFKLDLTKTNTELCLSSRLINRGEGRATEITLRHEVDSRVATLELVDPRKPFDLSPDSEQQVTIAVTLDRPADTLGLHLYWDSQTLAAERHTDEQALQITPQQRVPDWNRLLLNPPYTLNPIKQRDRLFGRDSVLKTLEFNAAAQNSTFLWGQKRVGKTSVLQVLASELREREGFVCTVLRMGEIKSLHEGQLAHRIAERLIAELGKPAPTVPPEDTFGAGLAGLIPFAETLLREHPAFHFVLIIDEFDDIDPGFYTGERGKAFVKALRSLSEMGLVFFFVGSERMKTIYAGHAEELNKWIDVHLDRIESREDCMALILEPVANAIEFHRDCVAFIVDYCDGNPFYMQLLCSHVFQKCWQDNRTYVSEGEVQQARHSLLSTLGETSFAHFWTDNPVLAPEEQAKAAAENALALASHRPEEVASQQTRSS